jgi:short-subunit dehydrogenase
MDDTLRPLRRSTISRFAKGWALVTGSARAEGLGYAFARQLAVEGLNLVLVDILEDQLHARADELRREFGIEVRTAACDLGAPTPYEALDEAVGDRQVDVLVCNHMFTPTDTPMILDMSLDVHSRMIDVNSRAYTNLIHRFGLEMRGRGRGAIVIVASGAGLTSAPFTGAYAANKAFQIQLGQALWYELRGTGVDVLVMIGGLMNTQGDALSKYPRWLMAETAPVAREVLSAVGRKHMVIPGLPSRAFLFVQTRLMTRRRALSSIGGFMSSGLGKTAQ